MSVRLASVKQEWWDQWTNGKIDQLTVKATERAVRIASIEVLLIDSTIIWHPSLHLAHCVERGPSFPCQLQDSGSIA